MDSKADLLKEIKRLQGEINKLAQNQTALTQEEIKRQQELKKTIRERINEVKELNKERLASFASEESSLKSMSSMYDSLKSSQKQSLDVAYAGQQRNVEGVTKILEINRSLSQLTPDDEYQRLNLLAQRSEAMDGLDKISKKLVEGLKQQNSLADTYANMTESQKRILQSQHDILDGIKNTIVGTIETAVTLYGNFQGAVGGVVSALGFVVSKVGQVNQQLGTSMFQTDGVARSAGVLSFVFDDAAGNARAIAQELGSTSRASFETQTNIGLMAMNMGISGGEAATLIGSFTRLNGNSEDVAFNLSKSTQEFAKQNGIIPAQLMSDLAQSAEEFALFGKQGGKNIIEAAGFAAKLGVNMKSISGISENLLDFESSITKELELGAMLGRNINLNKARELAFTGDIEGAAKETLKALGGQAAFEQMNYYQRKQTADLLGVSVSELQKMVANEQQAANLGGVLNEKFSQVGEFINGGLNKYLGTSLTAMGGMITAGAQLGADFKLASEGASSLFSFLKGGAKTTETVTNTVDVVTDVSSIADTAGDVGDAAGAVKGAGIGMQLTSLSQGLRAMGDPKVLFGALNLIPTGIGFIGILPGIPGMLALSVLGGPTAVGLKLLGEGLKLFGNTVMKALPQIGIGLLVLAGFGAAMIPLGYALGLAAPAISAFGDVIKSAFEGIATVVTAVSNGLVSMLSVITLEKAAAMVTLGAGFGLLAIGIGSLAVAALLGGRRVTRFIGRIAESASLLGGGAAQGLQTTAQALMSMGSGLSMINEQLDRLNPEKLEALSDFSMSLSISGALNSVGNAVGGLVDSVSALIGGGEEEGSLSQYETDALKYLERIAVATEKGASIKGRDRSAFNPIGINNN